MSTDQPDLAHRRVLALTAALFLSYLAVAMSLPAVPVHVVQDLGLSNAFGGLAVGIAFPLDDSDADPMPARRRIAAAASAACSAGLILYAIAGLICLLASWSRWPPPMAC